MISCHFSIGCHFYIRPIIIFRTLCILVGAYVGRRVRCLLRSCASSMTVRLGVTERPAVVGFVKK